MPGYETGRRTRSAGGAAATAFGIERVQRDAVSGIGAEGTETELVHGGLPDQLTPDAFIFLIGVASNGG